MELSAAYKNFLSPLHGLKIAPIEFKVVDAHIFLEQIYFYEPIFLLEQFP